MAGRANYEACIVIMGAGQELWTSLLSGVRREMGVMDVQAVKLSSD